MYSNKQNVLQLVALMRSHGVKKCVLCPGSRDIPLVQSILQCPDFETYSITDERSAGFFAIGLSLQTDCKEAVAVVVTSGSALLGLHAAVSEAFYQNVPLLVISADRPAAWIGQMDGQTLPQENVFKTLVKKSVGLVEVQSDEDRWFNNRMINEALLSLNHHGLGPVHINVPISDPFFEFSTPDLPDERVITRFNLENFKYIENFEKGHQAFDIEVDDPNLSLFDNNAVHLAKTINKFNRIMLVVGQSVDGIKTFDRKVELTGPLGWLERQTAIMCESIANMPRKMDTISMPDMMIAHCLTEEGEYLEEFPGTAIDTCPELVITIGGHIISKQLKKFLRASNPPYHIHVSAGGEVVDLFKSLTTVVEMEPANFLDILTRACAIEGISHEIYLGKRLDPVKHEEIDSLDLDGDNIIDQMMYTASMSVCTHVMDKPDFSYSHMQAMQLLLEQIPAKSIVHLANSSTVRYAQLFNNPFEEDVIDKRIKVMSNRGVNGIEGSLSTAMGYAAASDKLNFIVIGDLSFFYDMNALWNDYVGNNVRIVLLNNGGGEIFHALPGLKLSDKEKKYVTAQHKTNAQAWAESRGFTYHLAKNTTSLNKAINAICSKSKLKAPQFVEVITEAQSDAAMLKECLSECKETTQYDLGAHIVRELQSIQRDIQMIRQINRLQNFD